MDRGNLVGSGSEVHRSPVRVVREFLKRIEGRMPTRTELTAIEPELDELLARMKRVEAKHPGYEIQWSAEITRLLIACGKIQPVRKASAFRKAAGLL